MRRKKSETCNYCYQWILHPLPGSPHRREPYCPIWATFLHEWPDDHSCEHWLKPPPYTPERDVYEEQVARERAEQS